MVQKSGAAFIETMDCLAVSKLPEGPEWTYELKLDGMCCNFQGCWLVT
jgi:hypothetical protein